MQVIMVRRASGGFGEYELAGDGEEFHVRIREVRRRRDIEGLVHHGGPGGDELWGQVYEDEYGGLMVRVG